MENKFTHPLCVYPANQVTNFWHCLEEIENTQDQIEDKLYVLSKTNSQNLKAENFKENLKIVSDDMIKAAKYIRQVNLKRSKI